MYKFINKWNEMRREVEIWCDIVEFCICVHMCVCVCVCVHVCMQERECVWMHVYMWKCLVKRSSSRKWWIIFTFISSDVISQIGLPIRNKISLYIVVFIYSVTETAIIRIITNKYNKWNYCFNFRFKGILFALQNEKNIQTISNV